MFPKNKRLEDRAFLDRVAKQRCCICNKWPSDPSHIRTKGSGGPDVEWNVAPHCRLHHTEWGGSWSRFCKRYPSFMRWLTSRGWYVEGGKLHHPGLERGPAVGQESSEKLQVP